MTDEDPQVVRDWLVKAKPSYPIAIAKGGFENTIGVKYFPYSAVIAPDGTISFAGDSGSGEKQIEQGLSTSKKQGLWPKSLSKVAKLSTTEPVKAYAEVKKLIDGGKLPEAEKARADVLVAFLDGQAKSALAEAKTLHEKGHVLKALRKVEAYSTAQPPLSCSADCGSLVKELQALPEFKKEVAGGEAYLEAEALERDEEYLDAFEGFKSVSKKFAGTKVGDNAKAQAERIKTAGLPGLVPACESCAKTHRACDKHKKEVKL